MCLPRFVLNKYEGMLTNMERTLLLGRGGELHMPLKVNSKAHLEVKRLVCEQKNYYVVLPSQLLIEYIIIILFVLNKKNSRHHL